MHENSWANQNFWKAITLAAVAFSAGAMTVHQYFTPNMVAQAVIDKNSENAELKLKLAASTAEIENLKQKATEVVTDSTSHQNVDRGPQPVGKKLPARDDASAELGSGSGIGGIGPRESWTEKKILEQLSIVSDFKVKLGDNLLLLESIYAVTYPDSGFGHVNIENGRIYFGHTDGKSKGDTLVDKITFINFDNSSNLLDIAKEVLGASDIEDVTRTKMIWCAKDLEVEVKKSSVAISRIGVYSDCKG